MSENTGSVDYIHMAAELTVAWLSNPNTRADAEDASSFLSAMKDQVGRLSAVETSAEAADADVADTEPAEAAVSVRKSLASKDHIISMIDGKPYKTLRRHLSSHGLTPEQYRERYNLKADYPMVAENYSQARRDMAMKIGLGRKSASSGKRDQAA